MRLLVLVAVVAVVSPQDVAHLPYQFHRSSGGNFFHGHVFPYHQVQGGARVPGSVSYLNTYGQPTLLTHPMFGLATYPQSPVAPVGQLRSGSAVETFPAGAPVVPQQHTPSSEHDLARDSLSPLLKLAVDAGFVRASGISQSGSPQYAVSPVLAEDAGGVSELANRLDAIPVAAVHDVQMRPSNIIPDHSFSPVLIHKNKPHVIEYTLEVPIQ